MIKSPFGRRLGSQIIWPLVIVSVLIGIVATVVSVRVISDFTAARSEESVRAATDYVIADLGHHASSTVRALQVLAARPGFQSVISSGTPTDIEEHLRFANDALDVDMIVLSDSRGGVVAAVSSGGDPGDVFLPDRAAWETATALAKPVIIPFGEGYALWSQTDVTDGTGRERVLGSALVIDDELVGSLATGRGSGVLITDGGADYMALVVPSGANPEGVDPASSAVLTEALGTLLKDPAESVVLDSGGGHYRIGADSIPLATDPSRQIFVVCGVDASAARDAGMTTMRAIVVWSVVAVLVLVFLNWWVVRSVTTPLGALTTSTRRLAEGDFGAKVETGGPAEIVELAENFNRMTDSLSERSDALTKKVLELATLYEMSRSLGLTLDLEALLESVLDSALRIFEAEIGYIIMTDRESGALSITAAHGIDTVRPGDRLTANSMSEWVIREGRPLIFNPATADLQDREPESFSGAVAALCVPLQTNEGPIGSITVGTRDQGRRFTGDDVRLLATIANHVTIAIGNIGLFSSVQEAYLATVRALAAAVDAKDPYTRGHSEGVASYALKIGSQLGLSQEQMTALEMSAYLHDIGKIGISEDILLKPGKLTEVEMGQMRHHPLIGANILKPVAFPWPIAPVVRHHHEHYDGTGYPAGLRRDEIPMLARVLTVADAFEAMVADRPYRRGRSEQEAMLELRRCAGTQFDPRIVEAFEEALSTGEWELQDLYDREVVIGPDEAQAVFIAISDGLFTSFRRLGGPRLANNLEHAVNIDLRGRDIPFALEAGRLVHRSGVEFSDEEYVEHLRTVLAIMRARIEEASGAGLAEHFLSEAVQALPERMRAHAERLGFSPTI